MEQPGLSSFYYAWQQSWSILLISGRGIRGQKHSRWIGMWGVKQANTRAVMSVNCTSFCHERNLDRIPVSALSLNVILLLWQNIGWVFRKQSNGRVSLCINRVVLHRLNWKLPRISLCLLLQEVSYFQQISYCIVPMSIWKFFNIKQENVMISQQIKMVIISL